MKKNKKKSVPRSGSAVAAQMRTAEPMRHKNDRRASENKEVKQEIKYYDYFTLPYEKTASEITTDEFLTLPNEMQIEIEDELWTQ